MRSGRPEVEVLIRLDVYLLSPRLESVLDDKEIEGLEVLDMNVVPGVSAFTNVRYFFAAQGSPIDQRGD